MAANRQQGWSVFGFLLGFTLIPAGLFIYSEGQGRAIGILTTIIGVAILVGSVMSFYKIKPLEEKEE